MNTGNTRRCLTIPISGAISTLAWTAVVALLAWPTWFGGPSSAERWAMLGGLGAATWTVTTTISAALVKGRSILIQTFGYQMQLHQMQAAEDSEGKVRLIR